MFLPTKKRKHASKTPTPLGAVGIINPIDQDKQKITNTKIISAWPLIFMVLRQIKNPINFDKTNPISYKKALRGKKELNFIVCSNWYFEFESLKASDALPFKESNKRNIV